MSKSKRPNSIIFREWIEHIFSDMDPYNITQWRGRFEELVKRSQDIYAEHPEREDKVFGDTWNEWRHNPKNAEKIDVLLNDENSRNYPRSTKAKIFTLQKQPIENFTKIGEFNLANKIASAEKLEEVGVKMSKSHSNKPTYPSDEELKQIYKKQFKEMSRWEKIKFLTPYLHFYRTYPLGLEISLRFKGSEYRLLNINLIS